MSTTTPLSTDDAQWEASAHLKPVLDDIDTETMQRYAAVLAGLTTNERSILRALVENIGAEDKRTETQIALDLGLDRVTLWRARQKPAFQMALATIVRDNLRGLHDKIVGGIFDHGEKDWNAYKFLLQYDGSYVQSSRNLNVNASLQVNEGTPGSPQQAIDSVLQLFMKIGYDKQSFVDLVSERWTQMKAEGA